MGLIPLTDWDKQQAEMYSGLYLNNNDPKPNGIACPKCGGELLDINPMHVLACIPPKLEIGCPNEECIYHGYRVR